MEWHKKKLACSGNMLVNTSRVCYIDYMLSIFFSICQADSENVMDNSVSAWTSKGRWNTGKKIRQIRAEWAALVSLDL